MGPLVDAHARDEEKIGFILPLSGEYGWIGNEVARGIELALGDASSLRTIIEDAATQTPAQVVSTARRLLDIEGVRVLSVMTVDDAEPLVSIVKPKQVPLLVLWESSDRLLSMDGPVYSSGFALEKTGAALVRASTVGSHTRLALIGHLSPWAETIFRIFRSVGPQHGIEIVQEEMLPMDTREFKSIISRIKQQRPDSVFVALAFPSTIAAFLKEAHALDLSARFVTGEAFVGDGMRIAGPAAEGVIAPWPATDDASALAQRYREHFQSDAIDLGAVSVGFDGGKALLAALENPAPTMVEKFNQYFGPTKAAGKSEPIYQVQNGVLVPLPAQAQRDAAPSKTNGNRAP